MGASVLKATGVVPGVAGDDVDGAGASGRALGSVDDEHPTTTAAVAATTAARRRI
jgi:hypothetical protein